MIDIRYKNGKIYKLVDNTNGNIYYGSTIQTLDERLRGHNKDFRYFILNRENTYWCQSNKILMNNDYKIELIEDYACSNKKELNRREDYYIQNFNCINNRSAYNTPEQRKEKRKIYAQKRYQLKKSQNHSN